ncbi:MAG TPA: acylphosphatase [Acidimicrobiales bacterium]|nr:acylphosphatase [Acidimicrobiales bacterium]
MTPSDQATAVIRRRVLIHGQVQGVGFRASCLGRAAAAGLGGWVRNTERGEVEAAFEGPVHDVEGLVQWCRNGPSWARVDGIDVIDEEPRGETTFTIR